MMAQEHLAAANVSHHPKAARAFAQGRAAVTIIEPRRRNPIF